MLGVTDAKKEMIRNQNYGSIFQNLESGESYAQVKPAYHIGILNFSPFPDYPELFATNKMVNIKNNYIYNDNFTLNVLDLTQIHLATEEDKAYKIDYWAKLFKAKTWEYKSPEVIKDAGRK
ncbi:MAG: Rpn family recombination-promoting nuclease/putative transposase [Lachnospiraceae bacterium]|nr:Rpn family recombination-promoting nuclease/putative transposase [Lachnospiraceae bacterium]